MIRSFRFRALTFNAWALPVPIPSQDKLRRLSRLPRALSDMGPDLIVLQEMFDVRARRRLLEKLCPPYVTTEDATRSRRILGFVPADTTGGLLILSRLPIVGSRFVPHTRVAGTRIDERLGEKGAMLVRLDTPVGPLIVFAPHLYAGTRRKATAIRRSQLEPLLEALDTEAGPHPVLLAGDINASPTLHFPRPEGPDNPQTPEYAALLEAGFTDPFAGNPKPAISGTWVPSRNRYAALPYQETKTDERYDYVMVRPGESLAWKVGDVRTAFDDEDDAGFLSDHVGVVADLELTSREKHNGE